MISAQEWAAIAAGLTLLNTAMLALNNRDTAHNRTQLRELHACVDRIPERAAFALVSAAAQVKASPPSEATPTSKGAS